MKVPSKTCPEYRSRERCSKTNNQETHSINQICDLYSNNAISPIISRFLRRFFRIPRGLNSSTRCPSRSVMGKTAPAQVQSEPGKNQRVWSTAADLSVFWDCAAWLGPGPATTSRWMDGSWQLLNNSSAIHSIWISTTPWSFSASKL